MEATDGHRGGAGEPLVLLHGFAGSWRNWEPVLDQLEARHDVLAVALRGHALGRPLDDGVAVSSAALIDAVEADMDAAGLETAHLVGNSLGGRIALELAQRGRARSVVAFSPAISWQEGSRAEARARRFFAGGYWLNSRLLPHIGAFVRRPRLRRVLLSGSMSHGERLRPAAAADIVRANVECPIYFDLFDALMREGPPRSFDRIDCPVLIVWGTKDRTLPERRHAAGARRLLPEAEYVELPGAGHVPTADDPEGVARLIVDFAARAARR
jgi:pimeloyl-ACP methyl ester carboxylesterase